MCPLQKLARNILKNKIFFLPTDPNILEHVSGNTQVFFFLALTKMYFTKHALLSSTQFHHGVEMLT